MASLTAKLAGATIRRAERLARRAEVLDPKARGVGPRWIVLTVNNVCNLHCNMCDVGTQTEDTTFYQNLMAGDGNLSVALFEKLLDDAEGFTFKPGISFAYTEPGLHPDIVEMIAMAKRRGFVVSMTSNGFTLPRIAERIAEAGLDTLYVSVDGPPEIHNAIRGSKRSFERLYEGLEILAKQPRRPQTWAGVVLTPESHPHVDRLIDLLKPLKLTGVHATLLSFVTEEAAAEHNQRFGTWLRATATNCSEVDRGAIDITDLARSIAKAKAAARKAQLEFRLSPDLDQEQDLRTYHEDPAALIGGSVCRDPWTSVLIQTNGDVIPSHGRCLNLVAGNVRQDTLPNIFNSEKMRAFRGALRGAGGAFSVCTRCCGIYGGEVAWSDKLGGLLPVAEAPSARLPIL